MSQLAALEATVDALNLGPEHGALIEYCRGLAETIDTYPTRATLWREYRPALELLLKVGEVTESDGQAEVLSLVSTALPGTAATGTADARPGGRGSGKAAGAAVDAVAGTGRKRRPRASA